MRTNYTIFVTLFVVVLSAMNCTKSEKGVISSCENKLTEQEALRDFAVILSKAVAENEEMRVFLKEEALKEFDRDNDVFYPYVKNHVFSSGKSFQQELAAHEDYEHQLNEIEAAAPKLTILVPDFTWVDANCFSVKNWDTSCENLCVGYDDREDEHSLFFNGELIGKLPATQFPSFPVLIVKSNERMCVTTTKAGEPEYSFSNPAFDGRMCETKGGAWGYTEDYLENPSPDYDAFSQTDNFISYDELAHISPELIQAYIEFPVDAVPGVQRDYVYYGMTKQNTSDGVLKRYMRDMLYRFRLTPAGINFVSDGNDDPHPFTTLSTGRGDRPGFSEALPRLIKEWGKGRYELRLRFYQGYPNSGTACVKDYPISVAPGELISVARCFNTFQWNFFGNNWSTYSISIDDIDSKWYYFGDKNKPLYITGATWNLSTETDNLFLRVLEFDPEMTETLSSTRTYKETNSVSAQASGEVKKVNLGVSGSNTTETSRSDSYSYTKTLTSDDLLDCEINYIDSYIIAELEKNGERGYQLKDFGNEYFAISFLPVDTRKEYEIRQYLLGRKKRRQ